MEIVTNVPGFTLREAVIDDVPLVLAFIRELAEYEKLLHEVKASEEVLRHSLFGERKVAEALIGYYENQPACFALFFHNFSTFLGQSGIYIEDLYVRPAFRGKGFGRAIFSWLARLAGDRGCGRLEWWVLDWNEPALKFYRSLGAVPMSEWTVQRLSGQALERLAKDGNP
ncbi:MAG TPA: GNAT family N-acetyltransferase [Deltaproteobacteria bacterium]|nr:GNAT family N-acetyltransferase [Deltaproteobacteria bacterium]HPR56185.1 GNAT family N-acetyltransferase [Deltaproteobacteria bacterium]HXK46440.1 GNAT family N-acetyltransferase [Deltaproteobacteria bacterium]